MKIRSNWKIPVCVAAFALLSGLPYLIPHTGILSLAAFVPLFLLADRLREEGRKHKFAIYYSAFLLFNILTTWWIWNVSPVGAAAAIILNALQMTAIFAIAGWYGKQTGTGVSLLFFAVFWTAWEHVYYEIELSWPWLALGNSFAGTTEAVQWYEIFGTTGGTLWILLCNILIFLTIKADEKRRKRLLCAMSAALVLIPIVCSLVRYLSFEEKGEPVEIVVVQPNVDPFAKYGVIGQEVLDARLLELADSCLTPSTELIVTPETFTYNIDIDYPLSNPSISGYRDFLASRGDTRMLLGALTTRFYKTALKPGRSSRQLRDGLWYDSYNTAMVLDSSGVCGHYFKSKLVPGVEIVPYSDILPFFGSLLEKFGGSATSYATQERMEAMPCGKHKVGAMICYESIYGDYCRDAVKDGAGFMAVITNDGWWGDTPGYHQHFNYARLRAIEYRRDIIQAANTGTSGLIDQRGSILHSTGWWKEDSFRAEVHARTDITPFSQYGDVTGRFCALAFLLSIIAALYAKGKRFFDGRCAAGRS